MCVFVSICSAPALTHIVSFEFRTYTGMMMGAVTVVAACPDTSSPKGKSSVVGACVPLLMVVVITQSSRSTMDVLSISDESDDNDNPKILSKRKGTRSNSKNDNDNHKHYDVIDTHRAFLVNESCIAIWVGTVVRTLLLLCPTSTAHANANLNLNLNLNQAVQGSTTNTITITQTANSQHHQD